jgi:prefoldin alpha subunit
MADRSIDLDNMSLDQLNQLKSSEESRLSAISNHYSTLRTSAAKFGMAKTAMSSISPASEGKDILIPLTESLYVPGKIKDPSKVMVELGTGFYVEKNVKDAQAFLDRKIKLVDVNSENVMEAITATKRNINSIDVALQGKMIEIKARQEGMRMRTADQS